MIFDTSTTLIFDPWFLRLNVKHYIEKDTFIIQLEGGQVGRKKKIPLKANGI
jgi:hypothetical protein